jgi:hypothetical protein
VRLQGAIARAFLRRHVGFEQLFQFLLRELRRLNQFLFVITRLSLHLQRLAIVFIEAGDTSPASARDMPSASSA